MDIKIYQINRDRDTHNIGFMGYDRLERFQGSPDVNPRIYDLIYAGQVSCQGLEDVFRMFNLEHPADFKGHSLSVSDVVEVCESERVENGFYFCDSFGFKKISFDATLCNISERYNQKEARMTIDEKIQSTKAQGSDSQSLSDRKLKKIDFER